MRKAFFWVGIVTVATAALGLIVPALPQNPQTQTAPLYAVNAKYANGTAPGYWPTQQSIPNGSGGTIAAATGLNINIGPGTANCGSGLIVQYAGGSVPLTASSTNRIYLDTTSSCAVSVKTSAFVGTDIPIAVVVTSGSGITSTTDDRTFMVVAGSGSGIVSGQAAGVVPLAGGAALINAQSHIDENTPGITNVSQELQSNSSASATPSVHAINTGNSSNSISVFEGDCPNSPNGSISGCTINVGLDQSGTNGSGASIGWLNKGSSSGNRGFVGMYTQTGTPTTHAFEWDLGGDVFLPQLPNINCFGSDSSGKLGAGSCSGIPYPPAGLAKSTGSAWATPSFSDVVALWASGSCTSGYLKFDGTCSTPAATSVNVNGSPVSNPNFNNTTPGAGTNGRNIAFQVSSSNVSGEVVGDGNATHYLDGTGNFSTPAGGSPSTSVNLSQSPYSGSDLPVDYCTVTSGSNVLTCNSVAGWISNQGGIWIAPIQIGVGTLIPLVGTVCDHVTVSGSTLTMLTSAGAACTANFTSGSNQAIPAIHTYTVTGYGTSATNTLTLTATDSTFTNGMGIKIIGAGTSGADLICPKIAISGTAVTLFQSDGVTACNIGTTISSGTPAQVWHDDSLALQNAIASGSNVYVPHGSYYLSSESDITTPLKLYGDGRNASMFVVTKDAIKAIAINTSGAIARDFFIGTVDTFTPSSGTLVSLCDGTVNCFDNEIGYLSFFGGAQQIQVLNHTIQAWIHDNYGLDAHTNAAYYNNPQPYGDVNFTDNQFVSCNIANCSTTNVGLKIDASDTTLYERNKFNEFKTGIYISASNIVKNQRFSDNSCEKAGNNSATDVCVDIEGGAHTNNITWVGGEVGMFNFAGATGIKIGAGVTSVNITGGTIITSNGGSGIGVDNSGNASIIDGLNFDYMQFKNEAAAGSVSLVNNNFLGNTVSINNLGPSTAANGPYANNICFPNVCEVDNLKTSVLGTAGAWNFNNSSPLPDANFIAATFKVSYPNVVLEIPVATASQQGIIKPDGSTCTVTGGVLTCTGSSGATSIPICAPGSASGTAYTCTTSPTFVPAAGSVIVFKPDVSNSGTAATLNVNSSSAAPIVKWQITSVLAAADFQANTYTVMTFDGTNWEAQTIGNAPSGGSSGGVPTTIPNLVWWFSADRVPTWNNATALSKFVDSSTGSIANATNAGTTYNTAQINGLPAATFPGASSGNFTIADPTLLQNATIFAVLSPGTSTGGHTTVLSGSTNSLALAAGDAASALALTLDNNSVIGTSTTTLSAGVFVQLNATYASSTGAYAFRVNETAAGSGTNIKSVTVTTDSIGYDHGFNGNYFNGKIAELIVYNRVLTGGEITTIETYLHSKYGI